MYQLHCLVALTFCIYYIKILDELKSKFESQGILHSIVHIHRIFILSFVLTSKRSVLHTVDSIFARTILDNIETPCLKNTYDS